MVNRNFAAKTYGRWTFLPYCADKRPDGSWLFLNRAYKPLGGVSDNFYKYEEFKGFHLDPAVTDEDIAKAIVDPRLIHRGKDGSIVSVAFYHDGTVPLSGEQKHSNWYFQRIEAFHKLLANELQQSIRRHHQSLVSGTSTAA